ncbi:MAG: hypothetical protein OXFUSZZB_000983 [Candidatus Fervidibacter sp.]|jgi:hypothetical protein
MPSLSCGGVDGASCALSEFGSNANMSNPMSANGRIVSVTPIAIKPCHRRFLTQSAFPLDSAFSLSCRR